MNFLEQLNVRLGHSNAARDTASSIATAAANPPKGMAGSVAVASIPDPLSEIKAAVLSFRDTVLDKLPDTPAQPTVASMFEERLLDMMQIVASEF